MDYTIIRPRIWQIKDDHGVYATLIQGDNLAILWDTGYGKLPIRQFVEEHVKTDYIVVNSHGHPDHIGGNNQFDLIYMAKAAREEVEFFSGKSGLPMNYAIQYIEPGQEIVLGGLTAKIISLPGHSQGSIGLFLPEERILLAADALSPSLWVFHHVSCSFDILQQSIKNAEKLDFDFYLTGHSDQLLPKAFLKTIYNHTQAISLRDCRRGKFLGHDVCFSRYTDENGKSIFIFDESFLHYEIRKAQGDEYQIVKAFYDEMIDRLDELEYAAKWQKGVYPAYEYLRESIEKNELVICLMNGKIIAAMIVNENGNESYIKSKWLLDLQQGEYQVIHALGVMPSFARQGIGKKMVDYAINQAKDRYRSIRLDVLKGNVAASRLYESMGFVKTDTISMYYEDVDWADFEMYEKRTGE